MKVPSTAADLDAAARGMRPVCQNLSKRSSSDQVRRGWVVWAVDDPHAPVALAWRWYEAEPNVVALSDPLNIHTNAKLVSPEGIPLDFYSRVQCLVKTVYTLPWQDELLATLSPPAVGGHPQVQ
ncbi:MAG: hypothetical protein E6R08_09065 [Nevskiaceae bacterium]|nr:MAG: hypothetical protein E6R08_09065 [Nevskiaceae bacterium]